MAWYEILIVSVGLSLDVLTYALYKGAMLSKLDKKQILKMTLLFTGWQSGAMLLGSLISEIPYIAMNYQRTERLFRAASAVIFFLIAIWLIVRASRMRDPVECMQKTGMCGHRSCGRRIGIINNSSFTKVYI